MYALSDRPGPRSAGSNLGSAVFGVLASVLARARQRFAARRAHFMNVRELERLGLNPHLRRDLGLDY